MTEETQERICSIKSLILPWLSETCIPSKKLVIKVSDVKGKFEVWHPNLIEESMNQLVSEGFLSIVEARRIKLFRIDITKFETSTDAGHGHVSQTIKRVPLNSLNPINVDNVSRKKSKQADKKQIRSEDVNLPSTTQPSLVQIEVNEVLSHDMDSKAVKNTECNVPEDTSTAIFDTISALFRQYDSTIPKSVLYETIASQQISIDDLEVVLMHMEKHNKLLVDVNEIYQI